MKLSILLLLTLLSFQPKAQDSLKLSTIELMYSTSYKLCFTQQVCKGDTINYGRTRFAYVLILPTNIQEDICIILDPFSASPKILKYGLQRQTCTSEMSLLDFKTREKTENSIWMYDETTIIELDGCKMTLISGVI